MVGPTKNALFRIVTPCRLVQRHLHFGETSCLHISFSILNMSLEILDHGPVKQ
jgi:hypothetical protein